MATVVTGTGLTLLCIVSAHQPYVTACRMVMLICQRGANVGNCSPFTPTVIDKTNEFCASTVSFNQEFTIYTQFHFIN